MTNNLAKYLLPIITLFYLASCQPTGHQNAPNHQDSYTTTRSTTITLVQTSDAETIVTRKEVPVLCYHQIRNWTARDSKSAKDDICPVDRFKSQIKMLADSGYHSILPNQLFAYLTTGAPLPANPIMITLDDTDLDQFTIGRAELQKYNFKALYFIMTVSLGHRHYMTKAQVKQLSEEGNVIGSHTWDHKMVIRYKHDVNPKLDDWTVQVDGPTNTLEQLTGKKVEYFAYPYGLWNTSILPELKKHHFKAAFQLAEKRDSKEPLFTIRRIIGSGYWSASNLNHAIKKSFK
ncbi:polysaccharide deacetylase family protein [Mucilaginibacter robiniae]|uniref:Polysaccharide deacetylase family protein n=1 Tax=Mucilaginibacter robiniae TaxID=2728022 RepID=A0A7L5E3X6_9SPHI|nr:polysaccharide deacetylase family protein [Mucilaginibacter robiniae]QJD97795.1 polysaccharide deacetylase family protein [Mucilaginibacter robiniae]